MRLLLLLPLSVVVAAAVMAAVASVIVVVVVPVVVITHARLVLLLHRRYVHAYGGLATLALLQTIQNGAQACRQRRWLRLNNYDRLLLFLLLPLLLLLRPSLQRVASLLMSLLVSLLLLWLLLLLPYRITLANRLQVLYIRLQAALVVALGQLQIRVKVNAPL